MYLLKAQTITTLQPSVTKDPNPVCIGSVLDVIFSSTGVYSSNIYTAELSDSNGTFTSTPTIIGTFANSDPYNPNNGSPPGSISCQLPNVFPGCNYYVRVVSSSPYVIGSVWGPFCIGKCDITTNNNTNISFCISSCSASPLGSDLLIPINVNTFDSTIIYNSGNTFIAQLLNPTDFSQIGANGILGTVMSTHDTSLYIHIPCKDSLSLYGIAIGVNYLRIISTDSSSGNSHGTIVRISIGVQNLNPPVITAYDYSAPYDFNLPYPYIPAKDTFCHGATVELLFEPYNYSDMSTYSWVSSELNNGNPFFSPSGANSNQLLVGLDPINTSITETNTFKVQETNYGCVNSWSLEDTIIVLSPPDVTILGPYAVCEGDSNHYSVTLDNNTVYTWSSSNGTIIGDANNNSVDIKFNNLSGSHSLAINAVNQCGTNTSSRYINVIALPTPIITANDSILTSNYPFGNQWYLDGNLIPGANSQTYNATSVGNYTVEVTGVGSCSGISAPYDFPLMGLEEITRNYSVLIVPNPNKGIFRLKLENLLPDKIKIYTSLGQIIYQSDTVEKEINLSSNTAGLYYIQLQYGASIITKKLVLF